MSFEDILQDGNESGIIAVDNKVALSCKTIITFLRLIPQSEEIIFLLFQIIFVPLHIENEIHLYMI